MKGEGGLKRFFGSYLVTLSLIVLSTATMISCEKGKSKPVEKVHSTNILLESKYTRIGEVEKWLPVLYRNKDFVAVAKRLTDFLSDKEDEAKAYEAYALVGDLTDVKEARDVELKKMVLDEWCERDPQSHVPWLVRGSFYMDYAWFFRGGSYAKDVPRDAWPKFYDLLQQAQMDLEKSYQLNPDDPNSSCLLIVVAKGLGYPREKMEEYFRHALSAYRWHYGSYYQKLDYLKRKWHGSTGDMLAFAEECVKSADRHPYMGLIMIAAVEEIQNYEYAPRKENYLGRPDVWSTVEKLYERFFNQYPNDIRRRFFYAYHAHHAKKYDTAIKQFEIVGDRWIERTPWNSLESYNSARAFAYTAYAWGLPPENAFVYLKKSVDIDPTQKDSQYNLGVSAAKIGQYEEAEKALLKAVELDSCFSKAHLNLSWLYGKIKHDFTKAKEHAEEVVKCNASVPEEKAEAIKYIEFCKRALNQ